MEYVCETCGKTFERRPSAMKGSKRAFCSQPCYNTARPLIHATEPDIRLGRKQCSKCERWKRLSEFHPRYEKRRRGKLSSWCKSCHTASGTAYKRNNPDFRRREALKTRVRRLEKKYGITKEQYDLLLVRQNFGCAICGGLPTKKGLWDPNEYSFAVDHCHITGAVRGLLCDRCNRAIGLLQDSPDLLRAAATYLDLGAPPPAPHPPATENGATA